VTPVSGGYASIPRSVLSFSERMLPITLPASHRHNDLNNEVVDLLNRAVADKDGAIYAFGDTFSPGDAVSGIHDIHMNQGNREDSGHQQDNGIFQDGAVLVNLPS
jgi:uncharacterized protein YukJ